MNPTRPWEIHNLLGKSADVCLLHGAVVNFNERLHMSSNSSSWEIHHFLGMSALVSVCCSGAMFACARVRLCLLLSGVGLVNTHMEQVAKVIDLE